MKKQSTLIIACLASAAVGVTIGMLLSDETRKNFQEKAKKIGDDLMTKFSSGVDTANEIKNGVEEKLM